MKQEEKSLLLKDLCARIPYDPFIALGGSKVPIRLGYIVDLYPQEGSKFLDVRMHNAKPYLRPMSSMSEKEKAELRKDAIAISYNYKDEIIGLQHNTFEQMNVCCNWLNSHHFDYRGLIEKGLAIEAPEGMYKLKEE